MKLAGVVLCCLLLSAADWVRLPGVKCDINPAFQDFPTFPPGMVDHPPLPWDRSVDQDDGSGTTRTERSTGKDFPPLPPGMDLPPLPWYRSVDLNDGSETTRTERSTGKDFPPLPPGMDLPPLPWYRSVDLNDGSETTRTERSTGKGCGGKADIVFLLDKSGSVGAGDFNTMLEFVKDVTSKFDIGPNDVQIGVDTFSSSFNTEFTLGRFSSKNAVSNAVGRIPYTGGGTDTAGALTAMTAKSFTSSAGHRAGVPKVAVVVTDGNSNDAAATAAAAQRARASGIHILAVGVGNGVDQSELNAIASDPDSQNVFRAGSFDVLKSLGDLLAAKACQQAKPAAQQFCKKADIVFMLDSSGSLGQSNFRRLVSLVKSLAQDWDIGQDKVRVGVEKFDSNAVTEFSLNQFNDKQQMLNAIDNIQYTGGGTSTGAALKYVKDTMFSSNNGDRSNVPNFGIIITDGESNDPGNTKVQAELVRRAGITLFSVGVGANIKMSELEEMATDPDASHVFTVNDFSKLAQIKALFQRQTCASSTTCADKLNNCLTYDQKNANLCSNYREWSLQNCRNFCGLCGA